MSGMNKVPRKLPDGSEVMLPENMSQEQVFRLGREKGLIKKGALTANPNWIGSWDTTPAPPESAPPTPESYADFVPQVPGDVPESVSPSQPEMTYGEAFNQVGGNIKSAGEAIIDPKNADITGSIGGAVVGMGLAAMASNPLTALGIPVVVGALGTGLGEGIKSNSETGEVDDVKVMWEMFKSGSIDLATLGVGKAAKLLKAFGKKKFISEEAANKYVAELAEQGRPGYVANIDTEQARMQTQKYLTDRGSSLSVAQSKVNARLSVLFEKIARGGLMSADMFVKVFTEASGHAKKDIQGLLTIVDHPMDTFLKRGEAFKQVHQAGVDSLYNAWGKATEGFASKIGHNVVSKKVTNTLESRIRSFPKTLGLEDIEPEAADIVAKILGKIEDRTVTGTKLITFHREINDVIKDALASDTIKGAAKNQIKLLKTWASDANMAAIKKVNPEVQVAFKQLNKDYGTSIGELFPPLTGDMIKNLGTKGNTFTSFGEMLSKAGNEEQIASVMSTLKRAYKEISPQDKLNLKFRTETEAVESIRKGYVEETLKSLYDEVVNPEEFVKLARTFKSKSADAGLKQMMGEKYGLFKTAVNAVAEASQNPKLGLNSLFQRSQEIAAIGNIPGIKSAASGASSVAKLGLVFQAPKFFARLSTSSKHVNRLIKINKMTPDDDGKRIYSQAAMLVNDVIKEMYESGMTKEEVLSSIGLGNTDEE